MTKQACVARRLLIAALTAAIATASCSRHGDASHARGGDADGAPIPVAVATVARRDVPIYLDGLGTVQAYNTVTVRAQVGGQLVKVPFKEGDAVKAGQLIAQVDPRPYQATLDQALAKKAQDEALLTGARLDLKRFQDLQPDGYVTAQQVDQQNATVGQYEAAVKGDEAAIENDRVQLSYTTITAPISGIVGIRQVDVGNLVTANDATGIAVITQVEPITVVFTLPEQALTAIQAADRSSPLKVLALSRDDRHEIASGQLAVVDNQIDQSTGTIKLKASFENSDGKLWPGQFVNARLMVSVRRDGLVMPAQALQRGPDGTYVYVVQPDHSVAMRTVAVAQTEAGQALVDSGLQAGEVVVTDGQFRLQPGSKVNTDSGTATAADGGTGEAAAGDAHGGKRRPAADH